jgi:hypothetical protein
LVDPEYRFAVNDSHGLYDSMSDEEYLKKKYFSKFRKELDLSNPITFNEKLQWLKLYDRRPEYPIMVDKYAVKDYVAKIIGSQYIIPTIGVWDRFEDINFDTLPEKFVLKCTHDSGGVVIVRDKSKLDIEAARKKINRSLKTNYYLKGREWPYKNLKPRIIAEKYMEEKGKLVPEDYKVYCFNGEPKYIVCFHNRFNNREHLSETVYNLSWEPQNISLDNHFLVSNIVCQKPECLDELITICKKMCKNHIQVRLDFYIIDKKIYFGEITLFTASGLQPMIPPELDRILGDELDISELQNKASTDASSRLDAKKE